MTKETIIRRRPEEDPVFDTVVPRDLEERVKSHTILEDSSKKSVLIVDSHPRAVQDLFTDAALKLFVGKIEVLLDIHSALLALERKKSPDEPGYDVIITDTFREMRDSHSTAFLPVSGKLIRSYESAYSTLSAEEQKEEILPGLALLRMLWELHAEERVPATIIPSYRVLVDRKRDDHLISFRGARQAIESGCFGFYQELTLNTLTELFLDINQRYKKPEAPRIIAVCGASTSGKSSICRHLANRNPYIVRVPKYTTRPLTRRDWLDGDTKAKEDYNGNIKKDGVWWQGDRYASAFSRRDIGDALRSGKHCVISVARAGYLDYLDQEFGEAMKRVFILTEKERKEYLFEKDRKDSVTDLDRSLQLETELLRSHRAGDLVLTNKDFYNVVKGILRWVQNDCQNARTP